jgi:hypothetical protein
MGKRIVKREIYEQQKDENGEIIFDEESRPVLEFAGTEEVEEEESTPGSLEIITNNETTILNEGK